MKTTNLFKSIIAIAFLTAFVACTKQTDQMNTPKPATLNVSKVKVPLPIWPIDTTATR
jgi:hypothetical protein